MDRKVIVKNKLTDLKGKTWPEGLALLVKQKVKRDKMFSKLIDIVTKGKSFEEESLQYNYKGRDKKLIWECMEFFYQNLWNKEFREFIYTDPKDEWENYHIQLKYKDHFSEVTIVYGIGAFCVIAPVESLNDKKSTILDLEKINVKTTGDIYFESGDNNG